MSTVSSCLARTSYIVQKYWCSILLCAYCFSPLTSPAATIPQVVRCFEDADIHHVNGKVDPAEDAETINFELALADVTQIEKRLERLKKGRAKTKEEQASNQVCKHM